VTQPVALLLAAGASRRMGFAKALARIGDETFAERLVGTLLAGGCARVITVVAPPHEQSTRDLLAARSEFVTNPDPARGMASSLMVGLRHPLVRSAPATVVSLVDHPRIAVRTIRRLLARWHAGGVELVRTSYRGKGGHPYLVDRALYDDICARDPRASLRPYFEAVRRATWLSVDDAGVTDDIDDTRALMDMGAKPQ